MQQQERQTGRPYRIYIALAALLFAIVLAYSNSFHNEFQFDDFHTITDNPAIRQLSNIPRFFTDATTFSVLPTNRTYRPIVSTSLAIDYALGHGYSPFWFHLSTFLWFLVLVGCLFCLHRTILGTTIDTKTAAWLGLMIAAWFGLHPAMAETVNYAIQRGDLYATLGCVAALTIFATWPGLRKTGLYLLPLVLALLSKPPAAVFPLLLFFYVLFFEAKPERSRLRQAFLACVPSLLVTAALMALQSAMTPKSYTPTIVPAWDYRMTQPYVWLRYMGQLFLPIHLNVDTDLSPFPSFNAQAAAGLFFLAAVVAAIVYCARRRTLFPIAYGLIWFVVTQLPTSLYPLSEVENDHRMFFSFAGVMLAVVWGGYLLWKRLNLPQARVAMTATVLLALSGYAWGVHLRNQAWRTGESLWADDVKKSPHNGRGLMIYGVALMARADYAGALHSFHEALKYTPNYATLEINLGIAYAATGQAAEAERHFERAVSLTPNDDTVHGFYARWLLQQGRAQDAITQARIAVTLNASRAMQHDILLEALAMSGDTDGVRTAAEETLKVIPDDQTAQRMLAHPLAVDANTWINRSLSLYRQGRFLDAIDAAKKALELNPKSAEAYNNIGASYAGLQQWEPAITNEREALRLNPNLQIAKNNLAAYEAARQHPATAAPNAADLLNRSAALYQAGQYQQSILAAQQALKLAPSSAIAWNNIAAAQAAMKHWDEAIGAANHAIALDPNFQLARNNLAWATSEKAKLAH